MSRVLLTAIAAWLCLTSAVAAAQIAPIPALLVEPDRFAGQSVTIVGQFRGRNLFGDLPDAPKGERDGFVLRADDASIWVFGVRPRGKDFDLDPTRPVDTGLWLMVTGKVERRNGLVWIQGRDVQRAAPDSDVAGTAVTPTPVDVVFSAPIAGEVDVRTNTRIRIQLSEVINPRTLNERIRITFSEPDSIEPREARPPVAFVVRYKADLRAIEIAPKAPLERFREVTVELLDGITSVDGAVLKPWRLTFTTGGR